jgi:hypothetical protein
MELPSKLRQAVRQSWDAETCYPVQKKEWKKELPEIGQCAITALLLQDYLGGDIAFNEANDHFWNVLSNGEMIDLTRNQFQDSVEFTVDTFCNRDEILHSKEADRQNTFHRYALLKQRVENKLSKRTKTSQNKNIAVSRLSIGKLALQK